LYGERILLGSADLVALRHHLGRFAERDRPFLLPARIHDTPAHGRIGDLRRLPAPWLALLEYPVRGARHALDAARDERVPLARLDRLGRARDRLQPGAAQPVHGLSGHFDRQSRKEQRHAGDVAIVLAGLVRAAEDDVVDRCGIDAGVFHHCFDRHCRQIIRSEEHTSELQSPLPAALPISLATACNPEPHSRFTVCPGTSTGSPARSSAMRATLRLSSPAWFAQPRMTSSIVAGSTPECSTTALIGTAAKSSDRKSTRLNSSRPYPPLFRSRSRPPATRSRTAGSRSVRALRPAVPQGAAPCGRRCDCPRRPGSRSRGSRRRSLRDRLRSLPPLL